VGDACDEFIRIAAEEITMDAIQSTIDKERDISILEKEALV